MNNRLVFPEGFQNAGSRGGAVIFVDESAESVSALNCPDSRWVGCVGRFGCEQGESSMRALAVVMDRVAAEYVLEVAAADDQQAVETLDADGPDETFGVGVGLWRADRCLDDVDSFAAEDLVEGGAEFACRGRGSGTACARRGP
jgi:hypothetical protein